MWFSWCDLSFNSFMASSLSYGNQSIDLQSRSMDLFLRFWVLRYEKVKIVKKSIMQCGNNYKNRYWLCCLFISILFFLWIRILIVEFSKYYSNVIISRFSVFSKIILILNESLSRPSKVRLNRTLAQSVKFSTHQVSGSHILKWQSLLWFDQLY